MRLIFEPRVDATLFHSAVNDRRAACMRAADHPHAFGSFARRTAASALAVAVLCLAGCGTQPPRDFRGSWKPVNRFQTRPTEIPLERPYTFYAAPMDETLRSMLERWSKDTGRTLDYRLDYDITLYRPVTGIHTPDLARAAEQLNTIYAAQGVQVVGQPRRILVEAAAGKTASAGRSGARP